MKKITQLNELKAEGYFDALHDLVDMLEIENFNFKNADEQRKFNECINNLKDFKNHELNFLNGGYKNE